MFGTFRHFLLGSVTATVEQPSFGFLLRPRLYLPVGDRQQGIASQQDREGLLVELFEEIPGGSTRYALLAGLSRRVLPWGISPRGAHRSGRESLNSSGSCHLLKAAAFHQNHRVPPVAR